MNPAVTSDAALGDALQRYWGYTSFRPLQREAMDAILSGRDSIVVLPTGGGKSLCFQAPALADCCTYRPSASSAKAASAF